VGRLGAQCIRRPAGAESKSVAEGGKSWSAPSCSAGSILCFKRRLLRPPTGAESKSVAEGGKSWSAPACSTGSIDAPKYSAVLLVRAPFLFGWQKSERGGPSRLMPELLHRPGRLYFWNSRQFSLSALERAGPPLPQIQCWWGEPCPGWCNQFGHWRAPARLANIVSGGAGGGRWKN